VGGGGLVRHRDHPIVGRRLPNVPGRRLATRLSRPRHLREKLPWSPHAAPSKSIGQNVGKDQYFAGPGSHLLKKRRAGSLFQRAVASSPTAEKVVILVCRTRAAGPRRCLFEAY
jgi:hypothetical protein